MPVIITFSPVEPPAKTTARGKGRLLSHRCSDISGKHHNQRLPLGSIRGTLYLDALCLHCGKHFVWYEEESPIREGSASVPTPGK